MSRTWKPTGPAERRLPPALATAGRGSLAVRVTRAWRVLPPERRLAAVAAIALFFTLFLNWYQETVIAGARGTNALRSASVSLTGWEAFSFVEAAVLLVAVGVLVLLFVRAEGRAFHVPAGDGGVITAAGLWTCALVVWRIFDKQGTTGHGQFATTSGVDWGIFVALGVAGMLAYAGSRIRRAADPEPPLPGELNDDPVRSRRGDGRREPPERQRRRDRPGRVAPQPGSRTPAGAPRRRRGTGTARLAPTREAAGGTAQAPRTKRTPSAWEATDPTRQPPHADPAWQTTDPTRQRPTSDDWEVVTHADSTRTPSTRSDPFREAPTRPAADVAEPNLTESADKTPVGRDRSNDARREGPPDRVSPERDAARAPSGEPPAYRSRRRAHPLTRQEVQDLDIAEPPPSRLRRAQPAPYVSPSDLGGTGHQDAGGWERTGSPTEGHSYTEGNRHPHFDPHPDGEEAHDGGRQPVGRRDQAGKRDPAG